jgi:hypothetical protein
MSAKKGFFEKLADKWGVEESDAILISFALVLLCIDFIRMCLDSTH